MKSTYNIVMFAYNEQSNIEKSITSVYQNTCVNLDTFFLIANGCSDNTVGIAKKIQSELSFLKMRVIDIELGDKCNAWNTYIHELANNADVHFFVDADVRFSSNCFKQMSEKLASSDNETAVIAGLPLSGRNIDFYRSLVIERSCFFGNLYGLRNSFLQRIRDKSFRLPIGLNWIDSFLTKAVNTDLNFFKRNLPNRTTWIEGVGYNFDSLSPFKLDDIKLYLSRIARYELGKLQEIFLDEVPCERWPQNMMDINLQIEKNFTELSAGLGVVKRYLVYKRLQKLIRKAKVNP